MDADPVALVIAELYELAGAFRDRGEALARQIGQTQARWQVLSAASAEPKTVPQIARRLGVTRQAVQRLADLLAEERLARFTPNPDHQASPHLVLTEAGGSALKRLSTRAAAQHAQIAASFGAKDLAALDRLLRRLIAVLAEE